MIIVITRTWCFDFVTLMIVNSKGTKLIRKKNKQKSSKKKKQVLKIKNLKIAYGLTSWSTNFIRNKIVTVRKISKPVFHVENGQ